MHSDKAEVWRDGADVISPGFWLVSGVAKIVSGAVKIVSGVVKLVSALAKIVSGVVKMVSALVKIVSGVAAVMGNGAGGYLSVMTLTPRGLARMVVLIWPPAVRSCLTLTAP